MLTLRTGFGVGVGFSVGVELGRIGGVSPTKEASSAMAAAAASYLLEDGNGDGDGDGIGADADGVAADCPRGLSK